MSSSTTCRHQRRYVQFLQEHHFIVGKASICRPTGKSFRIINFLVTSTSSCKLEIQARPRRLISFHTFIKNRNLSLNTSKIDINPKVLQKLKRTNRNKKNRLNLKKLEKALE